MFAAVLEANFMFLVSSFFHQKEEETNEMLKRALFTSVYLQWDEE